MTTYRVRVGGSPPDSGEVFDDIDDAVVSAMEIAREMAGGGEVGLYDLRDRGGDMGVCPAGDDGAYWPVIEIAEV
jgi:hypothetical protein